MRKTCVVLFHVERDKFLESTDRIERIQEQPLVLECSPPGFDERVGERDVGLGEKPLEESRIDQLINGTVEVLDAAVNEEGWLLVDQSTRGVEQEFGRDAWIERRRHLPREYAAREVIDNGVKVRAGSIEKSNQRCIDMPDLVGGRASNAVPRLGWLDA